MFKYIVLVKVAMVAEGVTFWEKAALSFNHMLSSYHFYLLLHPNLVLRAGLCPFLFIVYPSTIGSA